MHFYKNITFFLFFPLFLGDGRSPAECERTSVGQVAKDAAHPAKLSKCEGVMSIIFSGDDRVGECCM